MNRFFCLFGCHRFDAEKWKEIAHMKSYDPDYELPVRVQKTFTNTCLECGQLKSKRIDL